MGSGKFWLGGFTNEGVSIDKKKQILKCQILQCARILGNLSQARFLDRGQYPLELWHKGLWKWAQMVFQHFLPYYDTNLFDYYGQL